MRIASLLEGEGADRSLGLMKKARFGARTLRVSRDHSPDLVLCLLAGLLPVAAAAAAGRATRVALFAHGREVFGPMGAWRRRLIQRCDVLLAPSKFTADWLAMRARVDRRRVHVVPLPIDARLAGWVSSNYETPSSTPALLTVSRLDPMSRYKGHFEIAAALKRVREHCPDVRWIVVGDGEDLPALRRTCHEEAIADLVHFTGTIGDEEMARLYSASSVFVLPSVADPTARPPTGEGFGLVYAEAGAFGLPSIASRAAGGAAEYVEDGVNGVLVPPGDQDALVEAILVFLENPELTRRMGDAARARTLEQHLTEHFAAALDRALYAHVG